MATVDFADLTEANSVINSHEIAVQPTGDVQPQRMSLKTLLDSVRPRTTRTVIYRRFIGILSKPAEPSNPTYDGVTWGGLGDWLLDFPDPQSSLNIYGLQLTATYDPVAGTYTVTNDDCVLLYNGEDRAPLTAIGYEEDGTTIITDLQDAVYIQLVVNGVRQPLVNVRDRVPFNGDPILSNNLPSGGDQFPDDNLSGFSLDLDDYGLITFDVTVVTHGDYNNNIARYRLFLPTHDITPPNYEDRNTAAPDSSIQIAVHGHLSGTIPANAVLRTLKSGNTRFLDGANWDSYWNFNLVRADGDTTSRVVTSLHTFRKNNGFPATPVKFVMRAWR